MDIRIVNPKIDKDYLKEYTSVMLGCYGSPPAYFYARWYHDDDKEIMIEGSGEIRLFFPKGYDISLTGRDVDIAIEDSEDFVKELYYVLTHEILHECIFKYTDLDTCLGLDRLIIVNNELAEWIRLTCTS